MTPWTVAYQAPLSLGFSRQEYWSGLPFPSSGDLPHPRIEPGSPVLQADALPSEPPGKLVIYYSGQKFNSTNSELIAGRNINNLRYEDDTTRMAESEELKSLLMKVKEESENVGLKINIHKTKIMASGTITSWQIDGETMETVRVYIWGLQNHCR